MLGAEIEFFDAGDYPLRTTPEMLYRARRHLPRAKAGLRAQPLAGRPVQLRSSGGRAPRAGGAHHRAGAGHKPDPTVAYSAPPVFLFEPHQPEQCNFKPNVILNIDEVWERSARRSRCWPRRSTSGTTTRASRCNAACRAARNSGAQHDLRRGVPAPLPAGRRRNWHEDPSSSAISVAPTAERSSPRSRHRGVATVHEAHGPRRSDEALHAPGLAGRQRRRQRSDGAGPPRRQLDAARRRRAVPPRRHPRRRRSPPTTRTACSATCWPRR